MKISTAQQHILQKQIFLALLFVCLTLFALYVYLISASIINVVMRTEIMQDIKKESSEVSLLEGRFIAAQYKVSEDIASLQGYTEVSKKIFIDRSAPVFVLADNRR